MLATFVTMAVLGQAPVLAPAPHWFVLDRPSGANTYLWGVKDDRGYIRGTIPPPGAPELANVPKLASSPFPAPSRTTKARGNILNYGVDLNHRHALNPSVGEVRGTDVDLGRELARSLLHKPEEKAEVKPEEKTKVKTEAKAEPKAEAKFETGPIEQCPGPGPCPSPRKPVPTPPRMPDPDGVQYLPLAVAGGLVTLTAFLVVVYNRTPDPRKAPTVIEYVILAGATGIFLLVLLGLGLTTVLRMIKPQSRGVAPSDPTSTVSTSTTATSTARGLLDFMNEVMKDAAAVELVKALTVPENNPHIPPFLVAKPTAKPDVPPVPNVPVP